MVIVSLVGWHRLYRKKFDYNFQKGSILDDFHQPLMGKILKAKSHCAYSIYNQHYKALSQQFQYDRIWDKPPKSLESLPTTSEVYLANSSLLKLRERREECMAEHLSICSW